METEDIKKPRWFFYPGWVILSVVSIFIAWNIAWVIISQIVRIVGDTILVEGQRHVTEDMLGIYVILPVLGLVTGVLQYLLLRQYLSRVGWWIAATFLGWLLITVVLGLFRFFDFFSNTRWSPVFNFVLAFVFFGGSTGLVQWLVLRQRVHRAALWILASMLGWGGAFLLTDGAISDFREALAVLLVPPIAASIAWWLLLDKLPQRDRENTSPTASQNSTASVGAG